ncbi:MAG: hypothetical protein JXD19_11975 [Deltaproteobacteria bacterium]|nr:hypothetical protein [Deltaproteobacteria bacterium]
MDARSALSINALHSKARPQPEPVSSQGNTLSHGSEFRRILADAARIPVPPGGLTETGQAFCPMGTGTPPRVSTGPASSHPPPTFMEQIRRYQEDQLLSHPGGDSVDLKAESPTDPLNAPANFLQRIGNNLSDAAANAVNLFNDLLWGSEYHYRDNDGRIQPSRRKGILQLMTSFFKNTLSGLSLGHYRPDGDPEPSGTIERLRFAGQKLIGKAVMDDIVFGFPSGAINLLDDNLLCLWNLLEVVPDATVGNLPPARQLVTTLFDNGQVVIDYITDCLPAGGAWMRVHAYGYDEGQFTPPLLYNLTLPEQYEGDSRWSTIRNTPFRKVIETIGSLLADAGVATATLHAIRASKKRE